MITDLINKHRIILASRSPRRQQLLKELGLEFEIAVKEYEEDYPAGLEGKEIALYVAEKKAELFKKDIEEGMIVITADTIVWCNGQMLGKPVDENDARRILSEISDNTHEVITGVCILSKKKEKSFTVSTRVTFDPLSPGEIDYYIKNFRPFDKAGAYGVQEWIGLAGCSHIEGSYFNVVGLPVHEVYRELKALVQEQ